MLCLAGASATWARRALAAAACAAEAVWLVRRERTRPHDVATADVARPQEELSEAHAGMLKLLTHAQALTADLKLRRMATFLTARVTLRGVWRAAAYRACICVVVAPQGASALLDALEAAAAAAAHGWACRAQWVGVLLQARGACREVPCHAARGVAASLLTCHPVYCAARSARALLLRRRRPRRRRRRCCSPSAALRTRSCALRTLRTNADAAWPPAHGAWRVTWRLPGAACPLWLLSQRAAEQRTIDV
jgi:hypothetical protein